METLAIGSKLEALRMKREFTKAGFGGGRSSLVAMFKFQIKEKLKLMRDFLSSA